MNDWCEIAIIAAYLLVFIGAFAYGIHTANKEDEGENMIFCINCDKSDTCANKDVCCYGYVKYKEAEKFEPPRAESEGINMQKINWDEIDKREIAKSVVLLDLFTKTYCRYQNDYERFDDLKFRCDECPFVSKPNGKCMCKEFKNKYAPNYRDFGSMGDL